MKVKPAYLGIILIFLMFGSTFAYAVMQSVSTSPQQQNEQTQLPTGIIDYELTDQQQYELLSKGYTLMSYRYNLSCIKCLDEKSSLEQITQAREFGGQIVLKETLSENVGDLVIRSAYGEERLTNFNATNVIKSLCKLLVSPPTECVIFQIANPRHKSTRLLQQTQRIPRSKK